MEIIKDGKPIKYVEISGGGIEVDVLSDFADGMATTVDSLVTSSVLMGYDAKGTNFNLLRTKTNGILQTLNALQIPGMSIYIVGLHKGTYTINNGTWPIDYTGFTGLTAENLPFGIINITTDEVYSCANATVSSTQITPDSTFNTGCTEPATSDILFIPIIQDVRTYDDSLDLIKVGEQAPLDQQVLEETLLSAVTAAGASSDVYVLDKKELTICVVASSVSTGGTFTFQGTPDQTNYSTVGSIDNTGLVSTTQVITASGTYFFEIVNASSLKWFRANLTARTDGTYTVYLTARA